MQLLKYDLSSDGCPSHLHTGCIEADRSPILQASTVISLGSTDYLAQNKPEYRVQLTSSADWNVLTSFDAKGEHLTPQYMQRQLNEYLERDDVFNTDFLEAVIIVTDENSVDNALKQLLTSWGCQVVFLLPFTIVNGPYFYSSSGIFRAWRLYPDPQEAFALSTIPSQDDSNVYQPLNAAAYGATTLCVAVPSRLYFHPTTEKPLAGTRIAVKDLFHLKGVHTGCGNRAYSGLYPESSVTSSAVQKAIDQGAIIVGKTKTAEFGGSQEVVGDWVDYSYPFNVRGDGYFVSTGSSTGSASAMAAYDWLDITLGTDAGGGVRDPAVAHGLFGLRPSHDGSSGGNSAVPSYSSARDSSAEAPKACCSLEANG
ncbi:hypothetical protein FQN54_009098 [Arachnomyces sp. PD_36]|nr:hypothetical protein FQN54_009098 [Arachnomyces sp. PD_36]